MSEGQYSKVIDEELPLLRKACKEVYSGADQKNLPNITIIIVGKRHHTRFYPTQLEDSDNLNPKPGTVVDRGVTMACNWAFFLQPHTALQGTMRWPTTTLCWTRYPPPLPEHSDTIQERG